MDWNNPRQAQAFLALHSNNPREGPGDQASTARAFAVAAAGLEPQRPVDSLLDVACGPGLQTRHLHALSPDTQITAFDLHRDYVVALQQWVADAGLEQRIRVKRGDMHAPPAEPASVDVIWCEGAAYILGVPEALTLWRPLLRSGGVIALTEPVFLKTDPPPAVVANWAEYPPMTDVAGVAQRIAAAGYELLEAFVLPAAAWAAYYDPLQRRLDELKQELCQDPDGALIAAEGQAEIDAWKNYGDWFSYAFFITRPKS